MRDNESGATPINWGYGVVALKGNLAQIMANGDRTSIGFPYTGGEIITGKIRSIAWHEVV